MGREIKFRAFVENTDGKYMAIQGTPDLETLESFMHHYGDQKLLMQFTGLKDKNGIEIYEGDVIYIAGEGKVLVEFPFFDLYERVYCGESNDIENILGNIHDNPELLKKKDE